MKCTKKLLSIFIIFIILVSSTGFNAKKSRTIDSNLLKDDFYSAVNKDWILKHKTKDPNEEISSFTEAESNILKRKTAIIKNLIKNKNNLNKDSVQRKIVGFYESILDTKGRNEVGIKPIEKYLSSIKSVNSISDLNKLLKDPKFSFFNNLFNFTVFTDVLESNQNILIVHNSSLHFENPNNFSTLSDLKDDNLESLTRLKSNFKALGYSESESNLKVENIFKLEKLLTSYETPKDNDDTSLSKNYSINEINTLAPNLNLKDFMESFGYDKAKIIRLDNTKWLEKLNEIYCDENIALLKDYFEISILDNSAEYLSDNILTTNYRVSEEDEAILTVDSLFGYEVAKLYLEKYFTSKDKAEFETIVKEIKDSYRNMLLNTNAFGSETKTKAIEKLDHMKVIIGFDKNLKDYSDLDIKTYAEGGSLFENFFNYQLKENEDAINSLGKSLDEAAHSVPPLYVNAFHFYDENTIHFPAGIIQLPFFDANRSKEENLGAIGILIAHEISHGFDTNGSKYDKDGKLNNWWTEKDLATFHEKANNIKNFYSKIEYLPGHFVNGELTLNENIADLSGVSCVLNILEDMKHANYNKFFISFAKSFRSYNTLDTSIDLLQIDEHSPFKVRVNTVFQQFDKFYETYKIKPKNKMYVAPSERLKIW